MIVDGGDIGPGLPADFSRAGQSESLFRKKLARGFEKSLPRFAQGLLTNRHFVCSFRPCIALTAQDGCFKRPLESRRPFLATA
jgi:hypothetical protein